MIEQALRELLDGLDRTGLRLLRYDVKRILEERQEAQSDSIIDWRAFSSLELAGLVAMIELRIAAVAAAEVQGNGEVVH